MIKIIDINTFKKAFTNIATELEDQRKHLNKLDSEIGDSDHGQSVVKAFKGADEAISKKENFEDISQLLMKAAKSIISSAGGATGPLYGSAFMNAAKKLKGKKELSFSDLQVMFKAMEEGIMDRGGAKPGDKTMLDTLHPLVEEMKKTNNLNCILKAAEQGKNSTKEMISNKGRSKCLGDRSKGFVDPGAESMYIILSEIIKTIHNEPK